MLIYAGIGSRKTPHSVQMEMAQWGWYLETQAGFILRSGGAKGADQAFASTVKYNKEIFTAADAMSEAFDHAAKYHPAWENCSAIAQALHARNSMILLGRYLNAPVNFVVCWTEGGKIVGGTGQALRVAKAYDIPVFNLAIRNDDARLRQHVMGLL